MPNNQNSTLDMARNYTLRALDDRNDFRRVHDLSGGYCKLSLWIELMNKKNGYTTFKTEKYEKAFIGRDHIIAQIQTVTTNSNSLTLDLFPVGSPAQPYSAFRKNDGVTGSEMGTWGMVVDTSPGQITIIPMGEDVDLSDLAASFAANGYVRASGDFQKNMNSGGKERKMQYPDTDHNFSAIKRDSWYQSGREQYKTRVTSVGDDLWQDQFLDDTIDTLLRKREFMQVWGWRGQNTDLDGDLIDQNGGVRWSVINRGGEYLPLAAAITETQFDNFLANMATRKTGSNDLTLMMGKGMLMHIQRNFIQGYLEYTGRDNTFGGESVDGLNILRYNIANMPVNFVELDVLNDQELFPEISNVSGLALPNKMSHTAFCIDTSPVKVKGGGTAPAIELISRRDNPLMAGYLNGMDKASVSQIQGALSSAPQIVTDIDASSFHAMIDDGIDMSGKYSGWIELTS